MISSMTGFGKEAAFAGDKRKVSVEIKSINSKQLDLNLRIPGYFREQESWLRAELADRIERGKVEVTISTESNEHDSGVSINRDLLKQYKTQIEEISLELAIPQPVDWYQTLFRLPDAFKSEIREPDETEVLRFREICSAAISDLINSRINEGKKLYDFFFRKLERLKALLKETEKFENGRIVKIRERLQDQLSKLQSIEYDKGRLEQELIFYIEKLDVTEEKVRLASHIEYFAETLGAPHENISQGKGKKLGFIAQEMGREINTLGSKANDADMQKIVVMMKDELEQIKEQVLNVL